MTKETGFGVRGGERDRAERGKERRREGQGWEMGDSKGDYSVREEE